MTAAIDVVIVSYNTREMTLACIRSLHEQTSRVRFETIVVDNASSDRTAALCRSFAAADRRARYFRNETNLGAARNFNRAFELGIDGWKVREYAGSRVKAFLMNFAHPHIPLYLASLLTLAVPVMSTAVAAFFLDEPVNAVQVLGMAVVLVAVALVEQRTEKGKADDAAALLREAEPSA